MSIPSSSDEVATTHRSSPVFRPSSMAMRCWRDTLPWWARAISSPASSFNSAARRSTSPRLLQNTIVLRCAMTCSSSSGYMAGQIERRDGSSGSSPSTGLVMSSTGTTISTSSSLSRGASTMATGRASQESPVAIPPTRNRAISSSGRWVADSPMRWGAAVISSSRSRLSDRCEPRLEAATAWISSMMTQRTGPRISRADDVSIRYRLSGVVMSTSGGVRSMVRRSDCGVSPVRIAVVISGISSSRRPAACRIPTNGARRLRSMSWASAFSGDTYSTRQRAWSSGTGSCDSRSRA